MSFNRHLEKFSVVHSDSPNHTYLNLLFQEVLSPRLVEVEENKN
jgi:hypothetical protein